MCLSKSSRFEMRLFPVNQVQARGSSHLSPVLHLIYVTRCAIPEALVRSLARSRLQTSGSFPLIIIPPG